MRAPMPGRGSVQDPGASGVAPGSGAISGPPVSVCHQVSTTAQRRADFLVIPAPDRRVDGLAGRAEHAQGVQPVVPGMRVRMFVRALISARIAVGAV